MVKHHLDEEQHLLLEDVLLLLLEGTGHRLGFLQEGGVGALSVNDPLFLQGGDHLLGDQGVHQGGHHRLAVVVVHR